MMIKSLKLVMMLVVSGALGCQDLPVVTLKNALRESTCKLSENQTEVDTFREHVFTKHGALTNSTTRGAFTTELVTCTTTCPEELLSSANFTWCVNIASLDYDVETCIRLGSDQLVHANSTCAAELLEIPDSLSISSNCPSIGENGCLRLVNEDIFYDRALLTCTLEAENCTSKSFSTLYISTTDYSPRVENFTTSPVSLVSGDRLVLYAEANVSYDYAADVTWQHGKITYNNFIYEDPYCATDIEECPNDARAKATRLKTERVKAYYYPLWDSSATCMFGVKSYLVVDNTTLDDNGEYFFNMTVTSRLHPLFSYTIIRTVNVSIDVYTADHDLLTTVTSGGTSTTGTPSSECIGSHCSSGGISPAAAAAIAVALVAVVVILTLLTVVFLCVRKKRKGHIIRGRPANDQVRLRERILPEPPPPPSPPSLLQRLKNELQQKNMLFPKHHLQLGRIIGEGESGLVYRGYINSGQPVAIKVGKILASESDKEKLLKEVSIMLPLSHPNVMSLIGLCFDGEVPLVIMPYMSDGSVLDYVRENKEQLLFTDHPSQENVFSAQKKCLDMCHQISKGMSYLAMQMFVHRDLAARNCMIDGLVNGIIKVADFGLAEDMYGTKYYQRSENEGRERVPIRWMAPESIDMNIYNEATDVWSFGVTCWEILTCGGVPYAGIPAMALLAELRSGHRLDRPRNLVCSDHIWDVLEHCWLADPQQRPKFGDLVGQLFNLLDSDTAYMKL